jgi:DNA adenine methylase
MSTLDNFSLTPCSNSEPVLRWAGSKRKIVHILESHSPSKYDRYIEPFVGSGALFFNLQPKKAILGDINAEVTTMYRAIKKSPEEVHQYLAGIPNSRDAYLKLREVGLTNLSDSQRAARLIFLMKGCFNGVYRTNLAGHFNVPFGSTVYSVPTLDALKRVSKSLISTDIKHGDYQDLVLEEANESDFIYLDPPYSASDRFRGEYGYTTTFRESQLDELLSTCKKLSKIGAKVMLSYKYSEQVFDELISWRTIKLAVPRSVGANISSRSPAPEILAMNY